MAEAQGMQFGGLETLVGVPQDQIPSRQHPGSQLAHAHDASVAFGHVTHEVEHVRRRLGRRINQGSQFELESQ